MISDFEVLGIEPTTDVQLIKSAYRKKMKLLHPDLSEDGESFRRHLLFIAVSAAYRRLLGGGASREDAAAEAAPEREAAKGGGRASRSGVAVHADPAYVYYRTGMKYFMMIHPSQWNMETQRMLNVEVAGKGEDQEIVRRKVMDLVKLFPKAYYYFSIVIHEYPESVWAYDSAAKTKLIEDRTKRYRHIIESFSSWNEGKREAARRRARIRALNDEIRKSLDAETEKKWRG